MMKKDTIFILDEQTQYISPIIVTDNILIDVDIDSSENICNYDVDANDVPVVVIVPENVETSANSIGIHNNLTNLQGGRVGERYHLSKREYDGILGADAPSEVNPFITKKDLQNSSNGILTIYKINGGNALGNNFHPLEKN